MRELSLYILDIAQNSISADASLIEIEVEESTESDRITIRVADNGRGMSPEQVKQVADPFFTTRTTRRVGMGIPLFRMAAEMAGGGLNIESKLGKGTTVTATFVRSHIDRAPLGDLGGTMTALIRLNPDRDFYYKHVLDGRLFTVDTRELRGVLGEVTLNTPEVAAWISEYMDEQEKILSGEFVPDEIDDNRR
jgi:hypothetical protein